MVIQQSILDIMLCTAKVSSHLADRSCAILSSITKPVSKFANAKAIGVGAIPAFIEEHFKESNILLLYFDFLYKNIDFLNFL